MSQVSEIGKCCAAQRRLLIRRLLSPGAVYDGGLTNLCPDWGVCDHAFVEFDGEDAVERAKAAKSIRIKQTEVLFRVLKELRREKSGFFKSLYIVSDARCPVIRFRSYDRHLVELSVNNKIGCQKSAYIGALVQADQSGLLRKLVLGLRLWAASNGVFSSEKKRTWNLNSYTLNLMFFSFLQSEKLLPVFGQSGEESFNGTGTEFVASSYSLANVELRKLLKKFFILCVERPLEKTLFSMHNGGLVPLDDFKQQLILKPTSILFVQDPIELSDNVAKNVTSKALKTMRHAMMLSLAAMKQNADSFAVMLRETADLGSSVVCKKLWMSRRTLRKKWSGLLKPDEQFPLLIEALVSMSLNISAPSDCHLQFHTFFDVHKDSLWVGLKLMEGETVDIANVAHFIEQMLTKTRDYLLNDSNGRGLMPLDEFTAQLRTIFEREKHQLK
ncbi:hypothetical protein TELCIR_08341 [Teladorsagia circumcincta]|uniref:Uncharacterized protein n=1 Tax=Teladorsagia circumcincta TaxID=45464 RepID=A0A2G9UI17_TELCI|nr:hypothetical protein TELCIR_08341 [Teladorsagia circumcincta]